MHQRTRLPLQTLMLSLNVRHLPIQGKLLTWLSDGKGMDNWSTLKMNPGFCTVMRITHSRLFNVKWMILGTILAWLTMVLILTRPLLCSSWTVRACMHCNCNVADSNKIKQNRKRSSLTLSQNLETSCICVIQFSHKCQNLTDCLGQYFFLFHSCWWATCIHWYPKDCDEASCDGECDNILSRFWCARAYNHMETRWRGSEWQPICHDAWRSPQNYCKYNITYRWKSNGNYVTASDSVHIILHYHGNLFSLQLSNTFCLKVLPRSVWSFHFRISH